jgi:hypothetical protein
MCLASISSYGMALLADLDDFIHDHRPHGRLAGDVTEPAWNGYLLTVACPCGTMFERWIMALDAELDLLRAALTRGPLSAGFHGKGDSLSSPSFSRRWRQRRGFGEYRRHREHGVGHSIGRDQAP